MRLLDCVKPTIVLDFGDTIALTDLVLPRVATACDSLLIKANLLRLLNRFSSS